jgi:hypothetical protein
MARKTEGNQSIPLKSDNGTPTFRTSCFTQSLSADLSGFMLYRKPEDNYFRLIRS